MESWTVRCMPSLLWMFLLFSHCLSVRLREDISPTTTATTTTTTTISGIDSNSNNNNNNNTDANIITNNNSSVHIRWRDEASLRLRRDGLRELRIAYRGILVLETSRPFQPPPPENAGQHSVRLLQVTDGRRLVQTVLEAGFIKDCRLSTDSADILGFVDQYHHGAPRRPRRGDVLRMYENTTNISTGYLSPTSENFRHRHRRKHALRRGVSMRLRRSQNLGGFSRYLRVAKLARECLKFQNQIRRYLGVSESVGNSSTRVSSSSSSRREGSAVGASRRSNNNSSSTSSSGRRRKRDLMTGWFIFPGTKWCGAGDIAEHENDLGYDEELDSCCRDHDLCPHIIPRVTWRYSLFNFHLHTISHCRCDRRFRRCLRKSSSPAAHMVGKIYFNVIGSQCFKFSKERTCKRRNWWGICKKYGFTKVAHPRKQRSF